MADEDQISRVARALCAADGRDPEEVIHVGNEERGDGARYELPPGGDGTGLDVLRGRGPTPYRSGSRSGAYGVGQCQAMRPGPCLLTL